MCQGQFGGFEKRISKQGGKTVEEVEAMDRPTLIQAAYTSTYTSHHLRVAGGIGGVPHSPSKNAPAPSPQPQISEMLQFMQFTMEQKKIRERIKR